MALFMNVHVQEFPNLYEIKHKHSAPYYPQGNGQVKAMNKTLLYILSIMVYLNISHSNARSSGLSYLEAYLDTNSQGRWNGPYRGDGSFY